MLRMYIVICLPQKVTIFILKLGVGWFLMTLPDLICMINKVKSWILTFIGVFYTVEMT